MNIFIVKLLHLVNKPSLIMVKKISVIFLLLLTFVFSSCYTITHRDPCPGLVEQEIEEHEKISTDSSY